MVRSELSQVLIEVEDDRYRDNKHDTVQVRADEFLDNIPVKAFQVEN
jgi:hypothetical protein